MNTTISRGLIRFVAGPAVAAGIIGGALGLAAVANASTTPGVIPSPTSPGAGVNITPHPQNPHAQNKSGPLPHAQIPNLIRSDFIVWLDEQSQLHVTSTDNAH